MIHYTKKMIFSFILFLIIGDTLKAQTNLKKLQPSLLTTEECDVLIRKPNDATSYGEIMKQQESVKKYFQDASSYTGERTEIHFSFDGKVLKQIQKTDNQTFYIQINIELIKLYDDCYAVKNEKIDPNNTLSDFDVDVVIFNNSSILMARVTKSYDEKFVPNNLRLYMGGTNQPFSQELNRVWENNWGQEWTNKYFNQKKTKEYFDEIEFRKKCWEETMKFQQKNLTDLAINFKNKIQAKNDLASKRLDDEIANNKNKEANRAEKRDNDITLFLQKNPSANKTIEENYAIWSAKGMPKLTYFMGYSGFLPVKHLNAGIEDEVYKSPFYKVLFTENVSGQLINYLEFKGNGPNVTLLFKLNSKTNKKYITYLTDTWDNYRQMKGYNKYYIYPACAGLGCDDVIVKMEKVKEGMFWYKGNLVFYSSNKGGKEFMMVLSYPGAEPISDEFLGERKNEKLWKLYVENGLKLLQDKALTK
jgi:hypothetical protein